MPKLHGIEEAGLSAAGAEEAFAPIAQDLEVLRQFNRRVNRLEQSGFSKRYENEIPNVIAKMDDVTFEKGERDPRLDNEIIIILRRHETRTRGSDQRAADRRGFSLAATSRIACSASSRKSGRPSDAYTM